ncbi:hypothetical protein NUW58_g2176 [Xylaria curta]|uniref:Uncharacterized protein n=1 Tax=Xylaria curta TaxID=42375 RepID=A0ACC1PHT5_9PEZI|nr:hypothetical protein NUW58_g2176 [Xylaria curta]
MRDDQAAEVHVDVAAAASAELGCFHLEFQKLQFQADVAALAVVELSKPKFRVDASRLAKVLCSVDSRLYDSTAAASTSRVEAGQPLLPIALDVSHPGFLILHIIRTVWS